MLPIKSPLDIFRVGVWGVRRNAGLVFVYVAWMLLLDLSYQGLGSETFIERVGAWVVLVIILGSIFIQFVLSAMLIFPLHATFLSDGHVAGFAAIGSFDGVTRVALRAMLIFFVALILAAGVLVLGTYGFGEMEAFLAVIDAAEAGDDAADQQLMWYVFAALVVGVLVFGASVILLGLRIPHLVDKGNVESASSSLRRGAHQFNRMAKNLAVGPGPVIVAQTLLWWALIDGPAEAISESPLHPGMLAMSAVTFSIDAFCMAMTAGVLSDAYRRALVLEASAAVS